MHRCGVTAEVPRMMSYVTYSSLPVLSQEPPTMYSPYKTNCQHIYMFFFLFRSLLFMKESSFSLKHKSDTTAIHFNEVIYKGY